MPKSACTYITFFFRHVYDVAHFMSGSCVEIGLKRWIFTLNHTFLVIHCSEIH